ncbi:hypothetical protein MSIM_35630 [Mycobacterium simiae]|nr:hypothetical protein MSIM_35630 [Mycobacterium simiae]
MDLTQQPPESGVTDVIEELVRMAVTWGVMCALVAFFYWMLSNIGTF